MSAQSKSMVQTMGHRTCEQLFHPNRQCWEMTWSNVQTVMPSTMLYFLPLILIAPMRKLNEVTLNDFKDSFNSYWRMCCCIYLCSVASQCVACPLNYLFNKHFEGSVYFLPVFLGNLFTFMLAPQQAVIVANSSMTMIAESYLLRDDTRFWRMIRNGPLARTVLFMCLSAFILDAPGYLRKSGVFWFIQPSKRSLSTEETADSVPSPVLDSLFPAATPRACGHQESCDSHISAGMVTYLKVALGLETMRILVSHFAAIRKAPLRLPQIFGRNLNLRIVAFLVGYSGVYRTINCALNRRDPKTSSSHLSAQRVASFMAAASYYLYPNRTVLAHAIVTAVRVGWCRVTDDVDKASQVPFLAELGALNWSHYFHMFGVAYLFHLRVFYPFWNPSMLMKTTSYLSGFNFDKVLLNTSKYFLGFE